jgi:hypothetical protein
VKLSPAVLTIQPLLGTLLYTTIANRLLSDEPPDHGKELLAATSAWTGFELSASRSKMVYREMKMKIKKIRFWNKKSFETLLSS